MSITQITSGTFSDIRSELYREISREYRVIFKRASDAVAPEHLRCSWPGILISELIELLLDAVSSGSYEDLFHWASHLAPLNEDRSKAERAACKVIIKEVEKICDNTIPAFSPLSGEITMRLTQLERLIQNPISTHYFTIDDSSHNLIDVAVDDIIRSLDRKDMATGEHSRVVSLWCQQIGQKLCLPNELIQAVTRGGLIHDIGKTTVPLSILQAPRKLTDDEWKIMASHVTAGHEMILQIPVLNDFQSIVRSHHEQFTGGGYPDNISGDDIPLATRIVTVADCFNAMIGRRPYRKQMSPESAIRELRRCRGKQFDPDVVDAMTEIVYRKLPTNGAQLPADWRWIARPLAEH